MVVADSGRAPSRSVSDCGPGKESLLVRGPYGVLGRIVLFLVIASLFRALGAI